MLRSRPAATRSPRATTCAVASTLHAPRRTVSDLDEDAEVTETYELALAALHVAPADLTEAAALVTAYQRLLTPLPEPEAR